MSVVPPGTLQFYDVAEVHVPQTDDVVTSYAFYGRMWLYHHAHYGFMT